MLAEEAVHAAGWFLEHAWLIPLIPGVAFAVIILFGKFEINGKRVLDGRAPRSASPAWWPSLVLAIGTAYQWIQYVGGVARGRAGDQVVDVVAERRGASSGSASTSTAWP